MANNFPPLSALSNLGIGGPSVAPPNVSAPSLNPRFGAAPLQAPPLPRPPTPDVASGGIGGVARGGTPSFFDKIQSFASANPDLVQQLLAGREAQAQQTPPPQLSVQQFQPAPPTFRI